MFRTLIPMGFSLTCMLQHASRVFADSVLPNQYATLVCGRAFPTGVIEFCNAGHPPPLLARNGTVEALEESNLPVGLFGKEEFSLTQLTLAPDERIVIYSDGVSEATDAMNVEYGAERLRKLIGEHRSVPPMELLAACRDDLAAFRRHCLKADDATLFVLARTQPPQVV